MKKCPKCGYSKYENEPFDKMMDRVLKESGKKLKKEMGYGIPDKKKSSVKYDRPKIFKGELDHVEREN